MKHMMTTLGALMITTTPAFAAGAAREDNSGLFVWIFLALCALIIVAQLIPAVMVLFGFAKGIKKANGETVAVETIEN
jgi:hypothetical protein